MIRLMSKIAKILPCCLPNVGIPCGASVSFVISAFYNHLIDSRRKREVKNEIPRCLRAYSVSSHVDLEDVYGHTYLSCAEAANIPYVLFNALTRMLVTEPKGGADPCPERRGALGRLCPGVHCSSTIEPGIQSSMFCDRQEYKWR